MKYRPCYPESAFSGIEHARQWVAGFVQWYNTEHLHSAIRFVTPDSRHQGLDRAILAKRTTVYEKAKQLNPLRWSGQIRNWSPITEVLLNPKKHKSETGEQWLLNPASPKISVMREAVKPFSDIDGVGPKNGFHRSPTTNASNPGKGLARGENLLREDVIVSSHPHPMSRLTQSLHRQSLENLP